MMSQRQKRFLDKQKEILEDNKKNIDFIILKNDSIENQIKLLQLKELYAMQLPNMTKEYVIKLLMNKNHKSLIMLDLDDNKNIIGGVTYRLHNNENFAEMCFFAICAKKQVNGYGTILMNYTKSHALKEDKIEYFVAYADNDAIGFFQKQGFEIWDPKKVAQKEKRSQRVKYPHKVIESASDEDLELKPNKKIKNERTILNDNSKLNNNNNGNVKQSLNNDNEELHGTSIKDQLRWRELIRDYVLSTPMICRIYKDYPYTDILRFFNEYQEKLYQDLDIVTNYKTIYPGMKFKQGEVKDYRKISGVVKTGYNPRIHNIPQIPNIKIKAKEEWVSVTREEFNNVLFIIVNKIKESKIAWPFHEAVSEDDVPDYYTIIKNPIDLSIITERVKKGNYYKTLDKFRNDFSLMFNNCRLYNNSSTFYYKYANQLEREFKKLLEKHILDELSCQVKEEEYDDIDDVNVDDDVDDVVIKQSSEANGKSS